MPHIDHTGFSVSDFAKAKAFYDAALKPLGIAVVKTAPKEKTGGADAIGYGSNGKPYFWVAGGGRTSPPLHIAFAVETRAEVDAFYKAAIAAGGRDNGPPGIRAHYHPNYYGAFVRDGDGHNIEAVCHKPA
jgi:catechol 2,3-dioxygenase-like lactoylglutathione lyase family enzyme